MANRKFLIGMALMTLAVVVFTEGCVTYGRRDVVMKTAVALQRVREIYHEADTDMKIFVDDVEYTLKNGETQWIIVNNGQYVAYAVLGNVERPTTKFTADSVSMLVFVTVKNEKPRSLLRGIFGVDS